MKIRSFLLTPLKKIFFKLQSFIAPKVMKPIEPFDLVITWVDWSNKYFVEQMNAAGGRSEGCESGEFIELKYLLRSIEKQKIPYRYIHIVYSDNHPPPKYLKETEKLFFVPHSKIVRDKKYLPLIHRESILIHLHRIPNLANQFFYLEDDFLVFSKRAFYSKIYDFHHKRVKVFKRKLNLKYDVIQSMGLWLQSNINAHRIILGEQFDKQNYGDSIMFEHCMVFLNRDILNQIEEKYQEQFLVTASYQNQKNERYKEKALICLMSMYNNYLVHQLQYEPISYSYGFVSIISTVGITDESIEQIRSFKKELLMAKYYLIANLQGNGISDEYPECKKIRSIYMNWLEKEFPMPTSFELKVVQ